MNASLHDILWTEPQPGDFLPLTWADDGPEQDTADFAASRLREGYQVYRGVLMRIEPATRDQMAYVAVWMLDRGEWRYTFSWSWDTESTRRFAWKKVLQIREFGSFNNAKAYIKAQQAAWQAKRAVKPTPDADDDAHSARWERADFYE